MQVSGTVEHGDGYGRTIGFPTINIDRGEYQSRELDIMHGIYGGRVQISSTGAIYRAAIVIGPIDSTGLPKLEAHLIAFEGDLYGLEVTYCIEQFIRSFRTYASETDLVADIAADIELIKKMEICSLE